MSARPVRLSLVYATWCPHCVPISTDGARELAGRWKIPLRPLDIDRRGEVAEADRLVREYGDWNEDYLVPQLFLEWSDGRVEHLYTAVPGPTDRTREAWRRLLERDPPAER